jgi:hypothetical protein
MVRFRCRCGLPLQQYFFSNDVDAFVVRFGYFMGKHWVHVQHRSLGESLGGKFIPTFSGGIDRATYL